MERRKTIWGFARFHHRLAAVLKLTAAPLHRSRKDDFVDMRITVTLEDDVAKQLHEVMRKRNASFKQVVNETLSDGLRALSQPQKSKPRQRTPASGQ
jgi:hypothetical protein